MLLPLPLLALLLPPACPQDWVRVASESFVAEINSRQRRWTAASWEHPQRIRNLISVLPDRNQTLGDWPSLEGAESVPREFDARVAWKGCNAGQVTAQANCAMAWAAVPASAISDRLCAQKTTADALSGAHILSCCRKCGSGCLGGYPEPALAFIRSGAVSALACAPFRSACYSRPSCSALRQPTPKCRSRPRCPKGTPSPDARRRPLTAPPYRVPNEEMSVKREILRRGPVVASIRMHEDFLIYRAGVYEHVAGETLYTRVPVKIIGWGRLEDGVGYWTGVNAWGTGWGENGTFRMGVAALLHGATVMAAMPVVEGGNSNATWSTNTIGLGVGSNSVDKV